MTLIPRSTPPVPGTPDAPVRQVLSAAAIGQILHDSLMRLIVQRDQVVIAERAVVGERHVWRRVIAQLRPEGHWTFGYLIRRGALHHELWSRFTPVTESDLALWVRAYDEAGLTICAWCEREGRRTVLSERTDGTRLMSHGICPRHVEDVERAAAAAALERRPGP